MENIDCDNLGLMEGMDGIQTLYELAVIHMNFDDIGKAKAIF